MVTIRIGYPVAYSLKRQHLDSQSRRMVHQIKDDAVRVGSDAYYLVQAKVAGSLEATVTVDEGFQAPRESGNADSRIPAQVLDPAMITP